MITKKDEVMETNRWLENQFSNFLVTRMTLKLNIALHQDRDQEEICFPKQIGIDPTGRAIVSTREKISRAEQIKLWEAALAETNEGIEKIKGLFEDESELK